MLGYKQRKINVGRKAIVQFNSQRDCYSVKQQGKVVKYDTNLRLTQAEVKRNSEGTLIVNGILQHGGNPSDYTIKEQYKKVEGDIVNPIETDIILIKGNNIFYKGK